MNLTNSTNIDLAQIIIKQFNPKEATQAIWDKLHPFREKNIKELYPDDSLPNREIVEKNQLAGWPGFEDHYYIVYKDELEQEIIATLHYSYVRKDAPDYEKNKNNSYFYIIVASEYRRQGIGSKLFEIFLKKVIDERGCKNAETDSYRTSGKTFCEKYGAQLINVGAENRLQMKDIDWDLINNWIAEGPQKAPNVTLENYSITPEKDIAEIARLETVLEAEMPSLDESEDKWEDIYTPEKLREYEKKLKNNSTIRYVLLTREKDGTISGMTETRYNPNDRPERAEQGLTGIRKEYRGRGMGKWLKAIMIAYVKENYPKVTYVSTGNAEHNAPMMSINNRLGFKAVNEEKSYKFNIKETLAKLQKK
ncbi:MAG: GNAT family N-acetyltransferase [Candidatus Heimdallarchaeota archaeon]